MEERRVDETEVRRERRSGRGPIIGLLVVLGVVLVVLIVLLVSGDGDSGDGISPGDIEVDIGGDD
ncbi:hypothetical protein NHL50_15790 [Acidimicrobiia bacterium EGI L10123]|uniref:hypothetical protein n=1 Tax=Salinilacustrithrix flava TaxID=2957203 RepID=UPI003D7C159E|nr:hypothetical protein [Acidimicrobiia bacterium EGI L10123]